MAERFPEIELKEIQEIQEIQLKVSAKNKNTKEAQKPLLERKPTGSDQMQQKLSPPVTEE